MPVLKLILVSAPILLVQGIALYWVLKCYTIKTKRWRFFALFSWVLFSIFAQFLDIGLTQLGWASIDALKIIHWIDKTVAFIGYVSVAVTCWLMYDHYKRLGYVK